LFLAISDEIAARQAKLETIDRMMESIGSANSGSSTALSSTQHKYMFEHQRGSLGNGSKGYTPTMTRLTPMLLKDERFNRSSVNYSATYQLYPRQ
jgi:hypothetical protein